MDVNTFEANRLIGRGEDERNYRVAAEMLMALKVKEIQLITNNPNKVEPLKKYGIKVHSVKPTGIYITPHNIKYLEDKSVIGGHQLTFNVAEVLNEVNKQKS